MIPVVVQPANQKQVLGGSLSQQKTHFHNRSNMNPTNYIEGYLAQERRMVINWSGNFFFCLANLHGACAGLDDVNGARAKTGGMAGSKVSSQAEHITPSLTDLSA
ncbi:hypothetical protein TNIN_22141 [Trichonephila inaurata madagascariensis]|uniref:Uncharacterized protein n=1 Tax=Trichonephila inaurata madagascariensis TaxID=2747483 RepID=A0A8X6Y8R0_9ARAC|nr:hypothetical protein TNIN_22141 [Trichonephila inaurata madagascariensis]